MADPAIDSGDPLAGWQPGSGSPVAAPAVSPDDPLQAAPKKGVLDTSYHTVPSDTRQGVPADDAPTRIRAATREGWESGDIIPPQYQEKMDAAPYGTGWVNRNIVNPVLNFPFKAAGALGGAVTSTVGELFNDPSLNANVNPIAAKLGQPMPVSALGRDINFYAPAAAVTVPAIAGPIFRETGISGPVEQGEREAGIGVNQARPAPTLSDVLQRQRAAPTTDPVTQATIDILKRNAGGTPDVPSPPAPFTLTPGPTAAAPPPSGLLGPTLTGGPLPGPRAAPQGGLLGPTMTADEIRARAEGYYSPADKAAAQGAMLPQDNANAVRSAVTDVMPSDPEKARYFASTNPTVAAAASDVSQFAGNPMSYDSAMQLDRRLTSDIRATKDPNEQRLLGQMQDGVRAQMDQLPDLDNLRAGRQAYTQYIKQSQMEDINYNASLKNDPAQADASVRQQAAAMLKNDSKMRNWTDDERAQLEQVAKSGDIGMLGRLSVGLVRPIARALGGAAGGWVAGPVGGIVGSEIGGDVGATQAARLRAYLSRTTLDPVMAQISRGVPPIPTPPRGP